MKTQTTKTLLSLLALVLVGVPQARALSDGFANATVITESNTDIGTVDLMSYTSEAGEPGHRKGGVAGALKSAWWRWTAPANGFCTADTIIENDDQFIRDTIVAVYTGATLNALALVAENGNHDLTPSYGADRAASATFYATQGTTYHIAVDGYNPSAVNANNSKVRLRLRHLLAVTENRIGAFGYGGEPGIYGTVTLSKTAGHAFTAKLMLAGKTYPFSGVFSLDGYFVTSFERKVPVGATPLPPLTLMLDGAQNGGFSIVSTISGNTGSSFSTVKRFTVAQPNTMKGLYSAVINQSGTLSLTASVTGAVTGVAVLPDGTKATIGSSLCFAYDAMSSHVPFATALHTNAGFFTGYLKITEAGAVDTLTDDFSAYFRPAKAGALFYPAGLNLYTGIIGSTYVPPLTGTRALGFLDGSVGAGKLSIAMQGTEITPAITENLTLGTTNLFKFTNALPRKPVLTLNKANGLVTGSILDQAGKPRTLTGVLYRDGATVKLRGQLTGSTFNPVFEVIP
ncbi:MAG: hypothetical protein ABL974_19875 [Prosthecobacter sp.]